MKYITKAAHLEGRLDEIKKMPAGRRRPAIPKDQERPEEAEAQLAAS
jgi:hypothetical protein